MGASGGDVREIVADPAGLRAILGPATGLRGGGRPVSCLRAAWRKLKGVATVRLQDGTTRKAELHWYEAHGIGRKEIKRKRYLD
jgi:hypothetical protein